jgi:phosphate transport system protein
MHPQLEGHTVKRFDGELGALHMRVLEMGGLVADQIRLALKAIKDKDLKLAHKVIERDIQVDDLEVTVDMEIASVLARRCPVAKDLRMVLAVSKAINDLERMGDEALKIASQAISMYDSDSADPSSVLLRDIHTIGTQALHILNLTLDTFDNLDVDEAEAVVNSCVDLDVEFQCSFRRLATFIIEDARNLGHTIKVVSIIKALERIGDHAKNMSEYVIYIVSGEDVRHQAPNNNHAAAKKDNRQS